MMMLVVFTVFLGLKLKVAVGTSTFIMTFTALIASVSHIMIHPAILLRRWPVLFYCMAVATATSLWSAKFANRAGGQQHCPAAVPFCRYWITSARILSNIP